MKILKITSLIKGHRDVNTGTYATVCPGKNIYRELSSIRDEVCYKLWPNFKPY
ncbi:hypothetical protein [Clostridium tepidiprofundi]|uniref:hypothetical protein n=1 Tax=Clostridium tepidiprofundi TaxID=420412 RepID=UPI00137B357A|nr:hypothetical protein [Clostridium tepidiprofundi]